MKLWLNSSRALATQLAHRFRADGLLDPTDWSLSSLVAAYDCQAWLIDELDESVRGWKVSRAPDGGVWAAPLPGFCLLPNPASRNLAVGRPQGIELELAFRFRPDASLTDPTASDARILAGLAEMAVALEVVSSRWQGWPEVDERLKIADLLNHGGLVVGTPVPYDPEFDFMAPAIELRVSGYDHRIGCGKNPAGDPRQLLPALVRQCLDRGLPLEPDQWITTGSYSGIQWVDRAVTIQGVMNGVGSVQLELIEAGSGH